jgi:Ca2+-binding EF-hand superfamily protein
MYLEMKRNAFKQIFVLMDSDKDGLLSSHKINVVGMESQILQLLTPLLDEMDEVKVELNEE